MAGNPDRLCEVRRPHGDDDEPPTVPRPELAAAWARQMCNYQERVEAARAKRVRGLMSEKKCKA